MIRFLFVLFFWTIPILTIPKLVPYTEIDPILIQTWDSTYPLPFSKILKKDLLNKGILYVWKDGKKMYLYSFEVFMPTYTHTEEGITPKEKGRNIIVKLYYNPYNSEAPYFVDLGEFEEKYNPGLILGKIKR